MRSISIAITLPIVSIVAIVAHLLFTVGVAVCFVVIGGRFAHIIFMECVVHAQTTQTRYTSGGGSCRGRREGGGG